MTEKSKAEFLEFWTSRFPEKGAEIVDLLRPFYGGLELKPALHDLQDRANNAIFWQESKKVRGYQMSDMRVLRDSLCDSFQASHDKSPQTWLRDSFQASLSDLLQASLSDLLQASHGESLQTWLGDTLADELLESIVASLGASLGDSIMASLRPTLRALHQGTLGDTLADSLWMMIRDTFVNSLLDSLVTSLFYPPGFILAGKSDQAAQFKPLHELWLAGNFPLGLGADGNFLVLVADPPVAA